MSQKRTHVFIPEHLLADIDKLVGKGKRSALITEILDQEIRRRRLIQILDDTASGWKDEDHPELNDGAYAWVRKMRDEDDKRMREKLGDWLQPRE
jgi:Arc/MetJ-type ribon-helix-helix transcriptional regulator